jgi:hypothetical protein
MVVTDIADSVVDVVYPFVVCESDVAADELAGAVEFGKFTGVGETIDPQAVTRQ